MAENRSPSKAQSCPAKWTVKGDVSVDEEFTLSNGESGQSEITFDYGRAEGGMPFVQTSKVSCDGPVEVDIIFSETFEGLQSETGDGPFFLFSNAMDTYRLHNQVFEPSPSPNLIQLPFAQRSQRYQRLILRTPHSSISISSIGYTHIRAPNPTINTFTCSNEKLNKIWRDGVRTVDMCTVEAGETAEAWEVTEEGTRIRGQHWAPCRHGTRWGDKMVQFEVKIEKGGASWGVHMVANGLIFCFDVEKRSLGAFEGLSDTNGVFPSIPLGRWEIPAGVDLSGWIPIKTIANGTSVSVSIHGVDMATVNDLDIHPILGGSANNTGSVAFGGPSSYLSIYRSLKVTDLEETILYDNEFKRSDKARTLADFAVGTNALSCTIDGAKRDRAVFGGDLFVMGRSIYHSTANFEAALGSIKLLTSHQTKDGYLGNLCPIQTPLHEEDSEPPTYGFYSLSYALLLVVAIKDYWMYSGDHEAVRSVWARLEKMMAFTERFVDGRGIVVAPPPLSMDWFPMCGPIFGASGKINIAYFDALKAMGKMGDLLYSKDVYSSRAATLKENIVAHLWNSDAGIMRMSDITSPTGVCQDINAYAVTTGVSAIHSQAQSILAAPEGTDLPLAFQGIERWDQKKVVSPYASGFAAEALFERGHGSNAVELIERVWGLMADESNSNYSGGHWEAMKHDGTPITGDTSLMHGWSTWPVYLLPRYLAGVEPLEPGWTRWKVKPVLAGLESVNVEMSIAAGVIKVSLQSAEDRGTGKMILTVPRGTVAQVYPPEGWVIVAENGQRVDSQTFNDQEGAASIEICRSNPFDVAERGTPKGDSEKRIVEEIQSQHSGDFRKKAGAGQTSFLRRVIAYFFGR
ncbi:hypothetical protein LSUE1_G005471 [Lachnellula suecica]|uniref:Alpha-L-rhamnosidase n=1 Tax=Lachnellula suecica TaxID=602035 RepID=A0A8T9CDD5_9HELO|nr:hypothetical protein LSUE1_G005471 [Lachnellula suecica]